MKESRASVLPWEAIYKVNSSNFNISHSKRCLIMTPFFITRYLQLYCKNNNKVRLLSKYTAYFKAQSVFSIKLHIYIRLSIHVTINFKKYLPLSTCMYIHYFKWRHIVFLVLFQPQNTKTVKPSTYNKVLVYNFYSLRHSLIKYKRFWQNTHHPVLES